MKILVTGGAGFLGSHLVDELLKDPTNQIVVLDDFSMGKWKNLPTDHRLVVFGSSILDDNAYIYENIDVVYHLAALTRPRWSVEHPEETNKININGTLRVLVNCRDNHVKKVIFVSSASTYGNQRVFPITEQAQQIPMCPYALTKVTGEEYCRLFERIYGLKVNIIRPFNIYGSRQNPEGEYAGAVSKFIDTLKKAETPFIIGDGNQYRDFVYVKDVVDLMILAAQSNISGEMFNAGSGISTSINEVYKIISGILKKDIKPNYIAPVIEPMTMADVSKAKRLLNWKAKTNLKEGLLKTISETI